MNFDLSHKHVHYIILNLYAQSSKIKRGKDKHGFFKGTPRRCHLTCNLQGIKVYMESEFSITKFC